MSQLGVLRVAALCLCTFAWLIGSGLQLDGGGVMSRQERQLLYQEGTEVELNLVLVLPINDPTYSVSLGFFLEGNYDLPPYNSQAIYQKPLQILEEQKIRKTRSPRSRVQRAAIYRAIEIFMERLGGMEGRACLLRSICEAAADPLQHDGLVGELLHVILSPSSTVENGHLDSEYAAAEIMGKRRANCRELFPACPSPPLDLFSSLIS